MGSRLSRGVMKSPLRYAQTPGELVQGQQTGLGKVVTDQVAPPPPFGFKEFIYTDVHSKAAWPYLASIPVKTRGPQGQTKGAVGGYLPPF